MEAVAPYGANCAETIIANPAKTRRSILTNARRGIGGRPLRLGPLCIGSRGRRSPCQDLLQVSAGHRGHRRYRWGRCLEATRRGLDFLRRVKRQDIILPQIRPGNLPRLNRGGAHHSGLARPRDSRVQPNFLGWNQRGNRMLPQISVLKRHVVVGDPLVKPGLLRRRR